jgi:hypothetical protein
MASVASLIECPALFLRCKQEQFMTRGRSTYREMGERQVGGLARVKIRAEVKSFR